MQARRQVLTSGQPRLDSIRVASHLVVATSLENRPKAAVFFGLTSGYHAARRTPFVPPQSRLAMQLTLKLHKPPVIQIALDYATFEEAEAMAKIGIEAGVDWLEIGTPLIVSQGVKPIGQMVRAFPNYPVLADYKTMDSGWKNVERTAQQGGHVMTVCANAPDETVQSAIAESHKCGVWVVADTIGVKHQAARARQCADWGVHMIYLHYGADQRKADASHDSTQWLAEVQQAVSIPIGVGCFQAEDAVRAASAGAELIAIGHPVISAADPRKELTHFVREVRAAYRPRATRS